MNIEITDWVLFEKSETLGIFFRIDDEEERDIVFVGDVLYDALVNVGLFESYSNGFLDWVTDSVNPISLEKDQCINSMHKSMLWSKFNHFIDTRVMRELVKLKIKEHD